MSDAEKPQLPASVVDFLKALDDYTELDPEAASTPTQLIINWGRKGTGFGMLSFFERDGKLECDNECMGRKFCKGVLMAFCNGGQYGEALPPLLARFDTEKTRTHEQMVDALLDACTPTSGEW